MALHRKGMMEMKAQQIYDELTAQLLSEIEQGIANPFGWRKPWAALGAHGNAVTGKSYSGFNQLALTLASVQRSYDAPMWATFAQWQSIDAQVRKGERAVHLVKWVEKECKHPDGFNGCDKCGGKGAIGFPVGFAAFNAAQVEGYTYTPAEVVEGGRLEEAEALVVAARASGLRIVEAGHNDRAFYDRACDVISMPSFVCFSAPEAYYATALHEMAHASGHATRLDREFGGRFGDDQYAFEELVAEFASAFLCATVGVRDCETARHGDYLANWARVLRNDSKALPHAASKAQQAANYWLERVAKTEERVA